MCRGGCCHARSTGVSGCQSLHCDICSGGVDVCREDRRFGGAGKGRLLLLLLLFVSADVYISANYCVIFCVVSCCVVLVNMVSLCVTLDYIVFELMSYHIISYFVAQTLRHRGLFPPAEGVNPSFSLLAEIRRVQQDHMGLLTPLAGCVRTGEHTAQWALTALEDIHSLVHGTGAEARTTELDRVDAAFSPHHWHSFSRMQTGTGAGAEPYGPAGPSVPHQNPDTSTDAGAGAGSAGVGVQGIALITQHYRESSAGRDLMVALVKNLMNPYISEVYLFNNEEFDFSELPHAHKIHQLVMESREGSVEGRLTFQNAFDFASAELRGRTVIIGKSGLASSLVHCCNMKDIAVHVLIAGSDVMCRVSYLF